MTVPHIFGTQPAGNVPASYLDQDFSFFFTEPLESTGTLPTTSTAFSEHYWGVILTETTTDLTASSTVDGLYVNHAFGTGTANRNAGNFVLANTAPTSGTTFDGHTFYTAVFANTFIQFPDGGGLGTERGDFFGFGGIVTLGSAVTHAYAAIGAEFDLSINAGASVLEKIGLQVVTVNSDAVKGSQADAYIAILADSTTLCKTDFGISFGKPGTKWPVSGTLIGTYTTTDSMAAVHGVDFTGITFSGNAFTSSGFSVDQSGNIIGGTLGGIGQFSNLSTLQSAGGTGFRWTLNNDATWRIQRTTDGFGTASVPLLIDASDNITLLGNIQMGQSLEVVSTFANMQIMQTHGGIGFRHSLNNDSTLQLQSTTNGFSGAATVWLADATTMKFGTTPTSLYSTAVASGIATQAFIKASSTANLGIYYGTSAPSFSAAQGSIYTNTTASVATARVFVNTNGSTGWAFFTASA